MHSLGERRGFFPLEGEGNVGKAFTLVECGVLEFMLSDFVFPLGCVPSVCQFLELCQSPDGGFGGGPGQYPHLAPTYAAVNALCIIGTEEAYDVINRYRQSQQ